MAIFVVMHGYALIFNDFLIEIGMGTSIVALLNSCSAGATSFAGEIYYGDILTLKIYNLTHFQDSFVIY